MNSRLFARQLWKSVVNDEVRFYRQTLATIEEKEATDEYWRELIVLNKSLDSDQQAVLLKLARQVAIDTTASFLGIIDGVRHLEGFNEKIRLSVGSDVVLSGDLQEQFFMQEQECSEIAVD